MSVQKEDIHDFIDRLVCNWWGGLLSSSTYEAGLYTFLSEDEVAALISRKRKAITKYNSIDQQHLLKITSDLIFSIQNAERMKFKKYLKDIACEIVEYKALDEMRTYLLKTFTDRYESNHDMTHQKALGIFVNLARAPHRLRDKLLMSLCLRLQRIATNCGFSRQRYFSEHLAFILAKVDILSGSKCDHKTNETVCGATDCELTRFNALGLLDCHKTRDFQHCPVCDEKSLCPTYHPCPTVRHKFKTFLTRSKKKLAE